MKTLTREMIENWQRDEQWYDRWDDDWVSRLFEKSEAVTATEILQTAANGEISENDALWAVLREEALPARTLRLFACDCAERRIDRKQAAEQEPDSRGLHTIAMARRFANGEVAEEEVVRLREEIGNEIRRVAAEKRPGMLINLARSVIDAEAGDAAWNAAWGAAADKNTGWKEERKWQVGHLLGLLTSSEERTGLRTQLQ